MENKRYSREDIKDLEQIKKSKIIRDMLEEENIFYIKSEINL